MAFCLASCTRPDIGVVEPTPEQPSVKLVKPQLDKIDVVPGATTIEVNAEWTNEGPEITDVGFFVTDQGKLHVKAGLDTKGAKAVAEGLNPSTRYWVQAYATNKAGTSYSEIFDLETTAPALEAVDLGLPSGIKWANLNLGATEMYDSGDYYAWGEVETKYDEGYWSGNYKWWYIDYSIVSSTHTIPEVIIKYDDDMYPTPPDCADGKLVLDSEDDAVRVKMGSKWRMPSWQECRELLQYCTLEWITYNELSRYKIPGAKLIGPNGNTVFIPAAGYVHGKGDNIYHWGESVVVQNTRLANWMIFSCQCCAIVINSGGEIKDDYPEEKFLLSHVPRDCGVPIRPVWDDSIEE